MEEILRCEKISKNFIIKDSLGINKRKLTAINHISLIINHNVNIGIVGESGSGKTTLAKTLTLLVKPDSGLIYYRGNEITKLPDRKLRFFRNRVRIIFQNPYKSLNPRSTVERVIKEAMLTETKIPGKVDDILSHVGLSPEYKDKYPHQMSGGERQRLAIARALVGNPECIIADEPTGSLDAMTEIHILTLLEELKKSFGITYVLISHNLKVIAEFCDRIVVMYRGQIVEQGSVEQIVNNPLHPYTQLLWNPESAKIVEEEQKYDYGCPFLHRCIFRMEKCFHQSPELKEKENDHLVMCFLYE
ncbi:MAG: ABC transporter ATP-binding protein [Candidatus Ratteibacteria bacterium]